MVRSVHSAVRFQGISFEGAPSVPRRAINHQKSINAEKYPFGVLTDEEERAIRSLLARAGLDSKSYKRQTLARRVPSCLRALKVASLDESRSAIERNPALLRNVVNSFLLGVTDFFRDPPLFEVLMSQVVPELKGRESLRVWSAGCSNGCELFSFAILLSEAGLLDRTFLLGTDCREDAVRQAQRAEYDRSYTQKLHSPLTSRYFEIHDGFHRPVAQLRLKAQWKQADLIREIEAGPWDVILWRNMSIYLNQDAAETIWRGLFEELSPGGFIVAGKAERPPATLGLISIGRCIYGKKDAKIDV